MNNLKTFFMLSLRGFKCRIELKKICKSKDTIYFLCSRGIGDTILFCTLLPEYKIRNANQRIALIVSDRHAEIVKWFEEFYDELILVDKNKIDWLNYNQLSRFYYSAPNFHYILPIKGISALGYRDINLLDLFKIELSLDPDTKPTIPLFEKRKSNDSVDKLVNTFIEKNGIERGKGVILAPYSYSVKSTPLQFWNRLVDSLHSNGFKVITNVQKGERPLPNTIEFNGKLNEICLLARHCGYAVSNRSGLCDLLALLKIKLVVVYPDDNSLTNFTFKGMGLKSDINEYLFENINAETVIQDIVNTNISNSL